MLKNKDLSCFDTLTIILILTFMSISNFMKRFITMEPADFLGLQKLKEIYEALEGGGGGSQFPISL